MKGPRRSALTMFFVIGCLHALGCQSAADYPDVIWACDNRRAPAEPQCTEEERGEAALTVAFYESVDGPLVFRLRDYGSGISCRILEIEDEWMKIELTTGGVGYVNLEEPLTTTSRLH